MGEYLYEIYFYRNEKGTSPIYEWMHSLARAKKPTELAQINTKIELLKMFGTRAGRDTIKYLKDDIWEIRPGKNRILLAAWNGNAFVLLHYFRKKTQKCPPREIEQAKKNYRDWIERVGRYEREI